MRESSHALDLPMRLGGITPGGPLTDTPPLILLAEDDPHIQRFLETVLDYPRQGIVSVQDGASAVAALKTLRPGLVVLDALMPGPDGFETCAWIRKVPAWRDLRVVIHTALRGDALDRAYACGADDFIPKGLPPFLLRARILQNLDPPLRREGPVVAATQDRAARSTLTILARQMGVPLLLLDEVEAVPAAAAVASVVLLDLRLGFLTIQALLPYLPPNTPAILLVGPEEFEALEARELDVREALLLPLSGLEARHRLSRFVAPPTIP